MAFAEDINLLGKDKRAAQEQLNIVQDYLKDLGMSISEKKCLTFQVVSKIESVDKEVTVKDAEPIHGLEQEDGAHLRRRVRFLLSEVSRPQETMERLSSRTGRAVQHS